jgi:Mn2+/Fe2+ NRAMP family transporter
MTHPALPQILVAGAQFGTKLLWTVLLTWPLMAAVQMMCDRIGKVTGQGFSGEFQAAISALGAIGVVTALLAANTINIGVDPASMRTPHY